jgi:hypothetical protein
MNSHTYIVRVWSEPNPGGSGVWRVSVMDSSSQERWYFSSPEPLVKFLLEAGDCKLEPSLERDS